MTLNAAYKEEHENEEPLSGSGSELNNLVMRMAQNRTDYRQAEKDITNLIYNSDGDPEDIDLSAYREHWYSFDYAWQGWVKAVEHFEGCENEAASAKERAMAKLLDRKAWLRQDLGHIRRSLCAAGRKLLRDA